MAQDEAYTPGPPNRRTAELSERPLEAVDVPMLARVVGPIRALVAPRTTRGEFAAQLLKRIGHPPLSEARMLALMAWMQAEGDAGRFNPLNATWKMPGSTTFNWAGVQDYTSFEQGVEATALTLNYGAKHDQYGYRPIRHALYMGAKPSITLADVEASSWGTGGLALRVYEDTKNADLMHLRYHRLVGA